MGGRARVAGDHVAAHSFRKFDDRCTAPPRAHVVSRDRRKRAFVYAEQSGIDYTEDEVRELVSVIERLEPFSEVIPALEKLKRGYQLTIFSNGDPDMLERARSRLRVPFERIISAAAASTFKPHVAAYRTAAELLGAAPESILFVASHVFDCVGAKAYGMRSCFVNRRGEPFGDWPYQPDMIVSDLSELGEQLCGG